MDAQRPGGSTDAGGIEIGTLQQHIARLFRDFRIVTPHNAGEGYRLLGIGDDEHVGSEFACNCVKRP